MRIAVDARCLALIKNTPALLYLHTLLDHLFASCPQHQFVLLANATYPTHSANVRVMQTGTIKNYFGVRKWYHRQLPKLLKEIEADFLLILNGCPAQTTIPQLVFINSIETIATQPSGAFAFLYKKYWQSCLQKAVAIAVVTPVFQQQLVEQYGVPKSNIYPIGYAIPQAFAPAGWQQNEAVQERLTGGKAFFLYTGLLTEDAFLRVLKAFSLFKKRQQSSLQLVIYRAEEISISLEEKLATYKYRSDVVKITTSDENDLAQLMAAAYAVIDITEKEAIAYYAAEAMQCQIPVIAHENSRAVQQVAGHAALYTTDTAESLAEQMKLVYKDENLRQQLVSEAQLQSKILAIQLTIERLQQCIEQTAAKNRPTFTASNK